MSQPVPPYLKTFPDKHNVTFQQPEKCIEQPLSIKSLEITKLSLQDVQRERCYQQTKRRFFQQTRRDQEGKSISARNLMINRGHCPLSMQRTRDGFRVELHSRLRNKDKKDHCITWQRKNQQRKSIQTTLGLQIGWYQPMQTYRLPCMNKNTNSNKRRSSFNVIVAWSYLTNFLKRSWQGKDWVCHRLRHNESHKSTWLYSQAVSKVLAGDQLHDWTHRTKGKSNGFSILVWHQTHDSVSKNKAICRQGTDRSTKLKQYNRKRTNGQKNNDSFVSTI